MIQSKATRSSRAEVFAAVGLALVFAGLPLLTHSAYIVGIATSGLLMVVAAAALNLVYGFAGLLSFAQLGFWGVGAYCSAIAVMDHGLSFWTGLVVAALVNLVLGFAVGLPILRTRAHAFVVVTITFALLCELIARDWISVTRGPLGIPGLPVPVAFGYAFAAGKGFYFIAYVYFVCAMLLIYAVATSRLGATLKAIRQNEPLARSQGVSPLRYKLAAFVFSAVLTGMAGAIFAFHLRVVDPLIFDFYYMQTFLIVVIIGGAGSFWGVALAGIVMIALPELLRFSNDLRMVIYGAVLIVAMLAMPRGVAGLIEDRRLAAAKARDA